MRKILGWILKYFEHIAWAVLYFCLVYYFFNIFAGRQARHGSRLGYTVTVNSSGSGTLADPFRPG